MNGQTIPVVVQDGPAEPAMIISAVLPGGLAPHTARFVISNLVGVATVSLDADGDGTVDFQGASLAGFSFTYSRPGLYTPQATIADSRGSMHTATTLVQVLDATSLDRRIQYVWLQLKDALRADNVPLALTFVHSQARDRYSAIFNALEAGALANIDQHLTTIQFADAGLAGAQYEMKRTEDGQVLSYAVWFQLDEDGLWRLRRF